MTRILGGGFDAGIYADFFMAYLTSVLFFVLPFYLTVVYAKYKHWIVVVKLQY